MADVYRRITILIADDDPEDQMLTEEALREAGLGNDLRFVSDGEELLDYLLRRGAFSDPESSPRPGLILLDLNMPKKDGREALAEIKAEQELRRIPVFVLTTSKDEEDVHQSYELGGSSFLTKPVTFAGLVEAARTLTRYRLELIDPTPDWHESKDGR